MKTLFVSILLFSVTLMTGCAAILSGGNQRSVRCDSDPTGAKVYVNGSYIGTTPTAAQVDKRKDQTFEFRLDGYNNSTAMITSSVGAGWIVCDILLGGIIGIAIDAATGSWMNLDQDFVHVMMDKKSTSSR